MRPLFTYYGSKWRASRRYPAPEHDLVIEPFAGSAGYSIFHEPGRALLLDKSDLIEKCWTFLLSTSIEEVLALPDMVAGELISDTPGIPVEAEALIGTWCAKGDAYQRRQLSAWARKALAGEFRHGSNPLVWGERVRHRLASQLPKIRDWTFQRRDYREAPDVEATWFVDPPYKGRPGSHYPHGSKGLDYEELATWCRTRKGLVIVCEGPGGDWLPFEFLGSFPASPKGGRFNTSDEFAWIHRTTPPPQGLLFPDL